MTIRRIIHSYKEAAAGEQAKIVFTFLLIATETKSLLPEQSDHKVIDVITNMQASNVVVNYGIPSSIDLATSREHSAAKKMWFVPCKLTTCKLSIMPNFLSNISFKFYR